MRAMSLAKKTKSGLALLVIGAVAAAGVFLSWRSRFDGYDRGNGVVIATELAWFSTRLLTEVSGRSALPRNLGTLPHVRDIRLVATAHKPFRGPSSAPSRGWAGWHGPCYTAQRKTSRALSGAHKQEAWP
jgi:hypothetical protein